MSTRDEVYERIQVHVTLMVNIIKDFYAQMNGLKYRP